MNIKEYLKNTAKYYENIDMLYIRKFVIQEPFMEMFQLRLLKN
jgi:hypothetical protein